jgi:precorrin-6B C5,15-methyltransferase / cobalt-precorrin-6B C5,C15-methyltransferase
MPLFTGSIALETSSKLVILGIGDDGPAGLTEVARRCIQEASVILGASSTLRLLPANETPRVPLDPEMGSALKQVREALSSPRPVLVSSGDPLFYGIARYLCDRLGKDRFEIIPHVSSMQLAFARVKESWDDAYLLNLAGKSLESVVGRIRSAEKVGLFPSEEIPPARLAKALLDRGLKHFRAFVCENLGSPNERVTQAELTELLQMEFDPLNVLILVRKPEEVEPAAAKGRQLRFGNPDELFHQNQPRRVVVTQAEVRALAIAQLDVRTESIVWDIGAGSGSFAIEAAQLALAGRVYAIEPRAEDIALIQANAEVFGVSNVTPIAGRAPEALAGLPDPDAVFIGGTGRHVGSILRAAFERLRPSGRIAVNVATIEALAESHRLLRGLAGDVQLWNVSIARGIEQLDRVRFQAINPSFLLAASKPMET